MSYPMTLYDFLKQRGPTSLFNFTYPIFDEGYRTTLEQRVIDYFLMRRIGIDNADLWHHRFKTLWGLEIGVWNERYRTQLLKFNPLLTECIQESHEREDNVEQLTDFGSLLQAQERAQSSGQAIGNILDLSELTKNTSGDNMGTTTGTTTKNIDTESDTDTSSTTERTLNSSSDETESKDTDGTKNVTGHSDRTTNSTSDATSSNTKTHSDYPQANIAAVPPENPGNWVTWTETDSGTTHGETSGTEVINNAEDTTTNEKSLRDKETSGTERENSSTNGSEDKTLHTTELTETSGTSESTTGEDVKQSTSDTRESKTNTSQRDISDRDSQLATSEKRKRKIGVNSFNLLSGYRNVSPSELISQFRAIIINVDREILDYLERLFMEVW